MLGAVKVRTKTYAVIRDFAKLGKAEYLVAAGIGENGAIPGHEFVQTTQPANQFVSRPKVKMISIAEYDLRADFFQRFVAKSFHCSLRAHRHEERGIDAAVRSIQDSTARSAFICFYYFEGELHAFSVSGENPRSAHLDRHIDGPNADRDGE